MENGLSNPIPSSNWIRYYIKTSLIQESVPTPWSFALAPPLPPSVTCFGVLRRLVGVELRELLPQASDPVEDRLLVLPGGLGQTFFFDCLHQKPLHLWEQGENMKLQISYMYIK